MTGIKVESVVLDHEVHFGEYADFTVTISGGRRNDAWQLWGLVEVQASTGGLAEFRGIAWIDMESNSPTVGNLKFQMGPTATWSSGGGVGRLTIFKYPNISKPYDRNSVLEFTVLP